MHLGFKFWNDNWSTYAYQYSVSSYGNVRVGYLNSILRVVLGTVLTLACTLLMAYPLSKRDLPGRTVLTLYVVITLFFGGGLIPLYLVVRKLGPDGHALGAGAAGDGQRLLHRDHAQLPDGPWTWRTRRRP